MKAVHREPSGLRDVEPRVRYVTILGFLEATIEPRYQTDGDKTCIVAVVADAHGKLSTAEIQHLTLEA